MSIVISDPQLEGMVADLAHQAGLTPEQYVIETLRERCLPDTPMVSRRPDWRAEVREIVRKANARPVLDSRSPDEIIGYDEHGISR